MVFQSSRIEVQKKKKVYFTFILGKVQGRLVDKKTKS